jgi:hypothetical protein
VPVVKLLCVLDECVQSGTVILIKWTALVRHRANTYSQAETLPGNLTVRGKVQCLGSSSITFGGVEPKQAAAWPGLYPAFSPPLYIYTVLLFTKLRILVASPAPGVCHFQTGPQEHHHSWPLIDFLILNDGALRRNMFDKENIFVKNV